MCPASPGIGVKTAAQLIGEYGDLETLLKRAGEIKQDKRRQTLVDNAEAARISKKLVTLDDKVPLDVPIENLGVHEPDYKALIAFLKAMGFKTLTQRVADKARRRCKSGAAEAATGAAAAATDRRTPSAVQTGRTSGQGQLPLVAPAPRMDAAAVRAPGPPA